ncbi:MAG: hypothetical protein C5B51_10900 [Terriglobia bacterium]|nr:MAG: hypothetical protein C5B51_10900 [Terriglobia bacterium]
MAAGTDTLYAFASQLCPEVSACDPGEQAFRNIADASPMMIWMANREGFWTFSNRTWLEFRGRTYLEELGVGWADGILPEDRDRCLREYFAAISHTRKFHIDCRIPFGIDGCRQIEISGNPWLDATGQPAGFIGSLTVVGRNEEESRAAARELELLSKREREVLELIARGYATKEAASKLGISYKTADSHRSHVLKKLGMHETASVVRFAVRSGLVQA